MQGTLILTILTVQSSYIREIEEPLNGDSSVPDTVQWWIAPTGSWRIKTFAMDHDIHVYSIGDIDDLRGFAIESNKKHYSDIVQSHHVIELADCLNKEETERVFRAAGLEPRIEIASGRFAFWKPDEADYHTQSEPK